jgi:predicted amidophosphoribosyltransferase
MTDRDTFAAAALTGLRCPQCGAVKPDNGWKVCAACFDKNQRYQHECDKLAMRLHHEFQRKPPTGQLPRELRRPSEMKGRKSRAAILAPYLRETGDDE